MPVTTEHPLKAVMAKANTNKFNFFMVLVGLCIRICHTKTKPYPIDGYIYQ